MYSILRIKTQVQLVRFGEIRPKLFAIVLAEDADEVKVEINPQHCPFMVERGGKLELDAYPLEKLVSISNDLWGTGQLTVQTICSFADR